jgi:hypothetical protein
MISIRVRFADGNTITTGFNGTIDDAQRYYVGNLFQFGDTEECPTDRMVPAVSVELI